MHASCHNRRLPARPSSRLQGSGHLTQAERLARAVRRHNIRVLIVHGDGDALVPAANSRRLAALLPNAEVRVQWGRAGWGGSG